MELLAKYEHDIVSTTGRARQASTKRPAGQSSSEIYSGTRHLYQIRAANTKMVNTKGCVFLDLQPLAKPRMTQADKWKKRPSVVRYWAYKDRVKAMLPDGYELPDEADICFAISMPKSWSKKKKQFMAHEPHRQRPDIDNLLND